MSAKPILFSGAMVRAILDGTKTQTRRVVKPQPDTSSDGFCRVKIGPHVHSGPTTYLMQKLAEFDCPYGQVGDRLWVREMFSFSSNLPLSMRSGASKRHVWYWADGNPEHGDWTRPKPSIHMPRWASRLTLEITDVRVQRVCDISDKDAHAEGVEPVALNAWGSSYYGGFGKLWDSLNAKRGYGWDANPWVWAITFKRVEAPDVR